MTMSDKQIELKPDNDPGFTPKTKFGAFLNRYFKISERGSSIIKEIIGGLVTFFAMFYALPVNAGMLSINSDPQLTQVIYAGVFAATALASGIATIIMGLYANFPIGLSAGMGVNAMIAYTVMGTLGFSFEEAMCLVFVDGIIFFLISVPPIRKVITQAIPKSLKMAIGAGIGFFICFIGLKNSGIVASNSSTIVGFGNLNSAPVIAAIAGIILVLVLASLPQDNKIMFWISKFSVFIALLVMGIICATCGQLGVYDMPSFVAKEGFTLNSLWEGLSKVFGSCFRGFGVFAKPESYAILFSLLFVSFFDSTGTLVGVEAGAGFLDDNGDTKVSDRRCMITDASGTVIGSVLGTTTLTSFVESTSGVAAGARTGLSALVTGSLFLLSLLIYPVFGMFSSTPVTGVLPVTSIALVYVGASMFRQLKSIDWDDFVSSASAFITVIMMVLTYSISDGIACGFIAYTIMSVASLKIAKKNIPVYALTLVLIALYIVEFTTYKKTTVSPDSALGKLFA